MDLSLEFVVDDKATKEIYWNAGVETCLTIKLMPCASALTLLLTDQMMEKTD